jgi:hypothetical protein
MKSFLISVATLMVLSGAVAAPPSFSVADYPSIQAALDANPGKVLEVPPGDHVISEKIRLRGNGSGLAGPGRIIQINPDQPHLEIEDAVAVAVRDLTLVRPEGKTETRHEAIVAIRCRDLVIENVRVLDNWSNAGTISLRECRDARISRCLVRNYMRVSIDDRTTSEDWGYAFRCTDGTAIGLDRSSGCLIEGNRIVEERLVPTREVRDQHGLGDFVKKNPVKGKIVNDVMWNADYTDAWQQGSAIVVNAPKESSMTRLLGNQIENAAQGIDIHSDQVIVANNLVVNAFIGMKAMHGSRNVLITGNQFVRNSLWAIGLMPGTGADAGNSDGGSIVANNLISQFGHGDAAWIWGRERSPFKFDNGQEPDDPPLRDVLVQGNVVDCIGEPLYRYAVIVAGGDDGPKGLRFANNLFAPGRDGVANVELPP